jgi:tRNA(Ile)-lysidine synthase
VRMDPAVAATRVAVRAALAGIDAGDLVLVAVSGGADSLALAGAAAVEAPRCGLRAGAVTVDHVLQAGSAERAGDVGRCCTDLGLHPVEVVTADVGVAGGPEAAARDARYAAIDAAADRTGATFVLLGHTLDDQAETVLLGLARGSGARSLAGMPARRGRLIRPFLGVRRESTSAACRALGLTPWDDPHNADPAYARARARATAMPVLEATLGPGVAVALARSASLLRDDADALDAWAERESTASLDVDRLADLPAAIRSRVLRRAAVAAGVTVGALTAGHVRDIDRLVTAWRGQGPVSLPGGLVAERSYDRLSFR